MRMHILFPLLFLPWIGASQTATNTLGSLVDSFLQVYQVPAIAVSVIKSDTILFGLAGKKRMDNAASIDFQSKFHLGSNTKALTSMLAAHLVESGHIQWSSLLQEIVPELKSKVHPAYPPITLESLLSHRAGIHPFEDDASKEWRNIPKEADKAPNSKLAFSQYALQLAPAKNQDKNHLYSNGGYIIAALMLEAATGKPYKQLIKELIDKAHLKGYLGFPNQESDNGTFGHRHKMGQYRSIPPHKTFDVPSYFAPAGHFSMDIVHFSKLLQYHLRGLQGKSNILSSNSYQKLHYSLPDYGLGWYNGKVGDTDQWFSYHGGSLGTFSSAAFLCAERNIAIAILINSDDKKTNELKNELRKRLWLAFRE